MENADGGYRQGMGTDSSHTSNQDSVENLSAQSDSQFGLLDLDVDLSVPEVYSGSEFTVYLHIKNPFGRGVWIKSVELSLPTQLSARQSAEAADRHRSRRQRANDKLIRRMIEQRESVMRQLRNSDNGGSSPDTQIKINQLEERNRQDVERLVGGATVHATEDGSIRLDRARTPHIVLVPSERGSIRIDDYQGTDEPERVPLLGSLPQGTALQPGCTDVWTIRLGTSRNPFFIPARHHLQFTVIYGVNPEETKGRKLYSNTTSFTIPVRAALWSVLLGGVLGGIFGSIGRSLQGSGSVSGLIGHHSGAVFGALALAVILSGAAVIFGSRKADAQSFITVEDFWGGVLVGFLIGYSGTAAFTHITGVHT